MSDVNTAFTRNSFVDKVMKWIPDDPLTQSKFIYYLTCIVFFGLIGYGLNAWYNFFAHGSLSYFFSGCFMIAIGLISFFGLKQTRQSYITLKQIYAQPKEEIKIDIVDDMKKEFDDGTKVSNNKNK